MFGLLVRLAKRLANPRITVPMFIVASGINGGVAAWLELSNLGRVPVATALMILNSTGVATVNGLILAFIVVLVWFLSTVVPGRSRAATRILGFTFKESRVAVFESLWPIAWWTGSQALIWVLLIQQDDLGIEQSAIALSSFVMWSGVGAEVAFGIVLVRECHRQLGVPWLSAALIGGLPLAVLRLSEILNATIL